MKEITKIQRSDEDIEIDRLFHFMVVAETAEARRSWDERWRGAINARNAARTRQEIEAIERAKGLRS